MASLKDKAFDHIVREGKGADAHEMLIKVVKLSDAENKIEEIQSKNGKDIKNAIETISLQKKEIQTLLDLLKRSIPCIEDSLRGVKDYFDLQGYDINLKSEINQTLKNYENRG